MQKKNRLSGLVVLVGHSPGALFATYLMAKHPDAFPWAIALDTPIDVFENLVPLKTSVSRLMANNVRHRYISLETIYGWEEEWKKYFPTSAFAAQLAVPNESHESMPLKSICVGLKFLFNDFPPPRKDLTLFELQQHYGILSRAYGFSVAVPLRVLLASATRKVTESRKEEILELLSYADQQYGSTERSKQLREQALRIVTEPDPQIDYYLNLPRPGEKEMRPFFGTWVGETVVKRGRNMPTTYNCSADQHGGKLLITTGRMQPGEPEVLHVTAKGELIVGNRNKGGGMFVATLRITAPGVMEGPRMLIGFTVPDDWTDEMKESVRNSLKEPDTVYLTKQ